MFAPDNNFNDYIIGREENRFSKLEWRAQFKPTQEIIQAQQKRRAIDMKQKKQDKSVERHEIHNDMLGTINPRVSDKELNRMTEISFWESLGFTNSAKREKMIV